MAYRYVCLLDIGSKPYSDRSEKEKATNEIAEKLATDAPNITMQLKSLSVRNIFEID